MKNVFFALCTLGILLNDKFVSQPANSINSRQLIVVKTADFTSVQAELRYYERDSATGQWIAQRGMIPVTVGRKGLAWGMGIHDSANLQGPHKREGDGKAPAGIFPIGMAFGSRPATEVGPLHLPYIQADNNTFCVDDPASAFYNHIVSTDTLKATWTSAERMLIPDYAYGLVVNYNYPKAQPNDGSCIFIHLWRNSQTGTAGCTAMSEANLLPLLRFLDARKNPLLVQMPAGAYEQQKKKYGLP